MPTLPAQTSNRRNAMRSPVRSFLLATSVLATAILAAPIAEAATVTGTVTGPDGKPFRAAFVQARHAGLKMTVSVLSDNQGKYVIENLPAGDYRVAIGAIGFKSDPKTGIKLSADQDAAYDFKL